MSASLAELTEISRQIRQSIITMLVEAKSGHSAGPLDMADVFTALYFSVLKHDPLQPDWPDRDWLFLSNGHICPVMYATLAQSGYFQKSELMTLRKINSRLQGHPAYGSLPGVESTSGPLGQGLSQACGVAYAFKLDNKPNRVFCLTSDAEHEEGQTWEAYLFGAKYQLSNLTVMIDRNHIQIEGTTEMVMPVEPLADKLTAFGWHVQSIDGHDIEAIINACQLAKTVTNQPSVIICNTIAGKGVDFMEGDFHWHGMPPNAEQGKKALEELALK